MKIRDFKAMLSELDDDAEILVDRSDSDYGISFCSISYGLIKRVKKHPYVSEYNVESGSGSKAVILVMS